MADDDNLAMGRTLLRGLRCRCLHCGEGKLFTGFLTLAPRCDRCGIERTRVQLVDEQQIPVETLRDGFGFLAGAGRSNCLFI